MFNCILKKFKRVHLKNKKYKIGDTLYFSKNFNHPATKEVITF